MHKSIRHTIVMTGASRGIGAVAADVILGRDRSAHLVVIGRNPGPNVLRRSHIEADLSSIESTVEAAREVADWANRGIIPPLTGFVGNAGTQYANDNVETADGLEATFAVNVIANHLLLRELEFSFTAAARVAITVSDTHFGDFRHNLAMVPAPIWKRAEILAHIGAFSNCQSANAGRTAYSTSKLAAIYLVHAWSRRLPHVVSFNPGLVPGTDLARDAGALSKLAMKRILPLLISTPVATSRDAAGRALAATVLGVVDVGNGGYVDRTRVRPSSKESYDTVREDELWAYLDALSPARSEGPA